MIEPVITSLSGGETTDPDTPCPYLVVLTDPGTATGYLYPSYGAAWAAVLLWTRWDPEAIAEWLTDQHRADDATWVAEILAALPQHTTLADAQESYRGGCRDFNLYLVPVPAVGTIRQPDPLIDPAAVRTDLTAAPLTRAVFDSLVDAVAQLRQALESGMDPAGAPDYLPTTRVPATERSLP